MAYFRELNPELSYTRGLMTINGVGPLRKRGVEDGKRTSPDQLKTIIRVYIL